MIVEAKKTPPLEESYDNFWFTSTYCVSPSSGAQASCGSILIQVIWKQSKHCAQSDTQILLTISSGICAHASHMVAI